MNTRNATVLLAIGLILLPTQAYTYVVSVWRDGNEVSELLIVADGNPVTLHVQSDGLAEITHAEVQKYGETVSSIAVDLGEPKEVVNLRDIVISAAPGSEAQSELTIILFNDDPNEHGIELPVRLTVIQPPVLFASHDIGIAPAIRVTGVRRPEFPSFGIGIVPAIRMTGVRSEPVPPFPSYDIGLAPAIKMTGVRRPQFPSVDIGLVPAIRMTGVRPDPTPSFPSHDYRCCTKDNNERNEATGISITECWYRAPDYDDGHEMIRPGGFAKEALQ